MMDIPPGWAAVIAALIVAVAGAIGGMFTWLGRVNARTTELMDRISKLEAKDRLSWVYIQRLIGHAIKHNALPLPDPPDGWSDND